jgi:hypothetical protein
MRLCCALHPRSRCYGDICSPSKLPAARTMPGLLCIALSSITLLRAGGAASVRVRCTAGPVRRNRGVVRVARRRQHALYICGRAAAQFMCAARGPAVLHCAAGLGLHQEHSWRDGQVADVGCHWLASRARHRARVRPFQNTRPRALRGVASASVRLHDRDARRTRRRRRSVGRAIVRQRDAFAPVVKAVSGVDVPRVPRQAAAPLPRIEPSRRRRAPPFLCRAHRLSGRPGLCRLCLQNTSRPWRNDSDQVEHYRGAKCRQLHASSGSVAEQISQAGMLQYSTSRKPYNTHDTRSLPTLTHELWQRSTREAVRCHSACGSCSAF